jgi:hypothetical protein
MRLGRSPPEELIRRNIASEVRIFTSVPISGGVAVDHRAIGKTGSSSWTAGTRVTRPAETDRRGQKLATRSLAAPTRFPEGIGAATRDRFR